MLARIVGIILGLILATSGYVIAGWGSLGDWATNLDLGPFEPHRPFAGGAAAILGGVLLVAALTPRGRSRSRRSRRPAPLDFGLAEHALMPVAVQPEQTPQPTPIASAPVAPAPVAPPEPVATPLAATPSTATAIVETKPVPQVDPAPALVPMPTPVSASVKAPETFDQMRERMIALSRAESWAEAARALMAMKAAARGDLELATVYCDLGDFARAQGQMDDAADAYDTAVSHARDAYRTAPQDVAVIELLAGTLSGVGDAAEAEGRLDEALSAFEEALALRRSQGGREALDPAAQRALSVSLERLADLREDRGHRMRALDLYRESYDVAARLAARDPARFGSDLEVTRQRLAELEAKVAL